MKKNIDKSTISKSIHEIPKKNIILKSSYVFSLILLLLSIIRVPYIGQFIDATIFSFLFGYTKYLIYGYLIILFSLLLFNIKIKPFFNLRLCISFFMITIFISLILSAINNFVNPENIKISYFLNYWNNSMYHFSNTIGPFGADGFIDGGIIGVSINSINGAFVIILSILAICFIIIYFIFNKRNFLLQLNKSKKFQNSELSKFLVSIKKNKINKNYLKNYWSDPKQNYLNLNEYSLKFRNNFDDSGIENLIQNFLQDNEIKYEGMRIVKTDESVDFIIIMESNNYIKYKANLINFKANLKNENYSSTYLNNELIISFTLSYKIKNKNILNILETKLHKPLDYVFGLSPKEQPIILNLIKNPLILYIDQTEENVKNLINNLIISFSYFYKATNLNILYLDPTGTLENSNILKNANCVSVKTNNEKEVLFHLEKYKNYIDNVITHLDANNYKDIYESNNYDKKIIKNRVLIINHFNLLTNNKRILQLILYFIEISVKCGISIHIIDTSYEVKTYNKIDFDFICFMKTDKEISLKILQDESATKLDPYNNFILYNKLKNEKYIGYLPIIDKEIYILMKNLYSCFKNNGF